MLKKILLLGTGGFIGSNLRYWISYGLHTLVKTSFPLGTLSVNILGSFMLGAVLNFVIASKPLSSDVKLLIGTGLIGALTTFSTFSFETLQLMKTHSIRLALYNVFLNIVIGFAACLLGMYTTSKLS